MSSKLFPGVVVLELYESCECNGRNDPQLSLNFWFDSMLALFCGQVASILEFGIRVTPLPAGPET